MSDPQQVEEISAWPHEITSDLSYALELMSLGAVAMNAREEGFDEIADWFETLGKAEKSHSPVIDTGE